MATITRPTATITVPQGTKSTPCRGCNAQIYFVRTKVGRFAPVDCDPARVEGARVPTGVVDPLQQAFALDGGRTQPPTPRDGLGASHFATCPQADRFR